MNLFYKPNYKDYRHFMYISIKIHIRTNLYEMCGDSLLHIDY